MLFIKQSLSAATTHTALQFNVDGKAVATQNPCTTDHTSSFGEMSWISSAHHIHHLLFNLIHPSSTMALQEVIGINIVMPKNIRRLTHVIH